MFPVMPVKGNKQEQELIKIFKALDAQNQESLLAFAKFLFSQETSETEESEPILETVTEPLGLKRPQNESVVKAIKRLSANYPMVNKDNILHPISGLMTAHMLQGKEASDVIDELEDLFAKEFSQFRDSLQSGE